MADEVATAPARTIDDDPIEEWVAHPTPQAATRPATKPATKPAARPAAEPATGARPVTVIDTGRRHPMLRALAVILLAAAILAAGVAAGYLFTSIIGH